MHDLSFEALTQGEVPLSDQLCKSRVLLKFDESAWRAIRCDLAGEVPPGPPQRCAGCSRGSTAMGERRGEVVGALRGEGAAARAEREGESAGCAQE